MRNPLPLIALSLLGLGLTACGKQGTTERYGRIPEVEPNMNTTEGYDPKDPDLSTYKSRGPVRAVKLVGLYRATLDPSLKWHWSITKRVLDRPDTFDCEGYVRYIYRLFLGREPWPNFVAGELVDHTDRFRIVPASEARRGDLVVWREKDGWGTSDHVAIYDGVIDFKTKAGTIQIPMVVTTSTSAEENGQHAIRRMRLSSVKKRRSGNKGPYFLEVL